MKDWDRNQTPQSLDHLCCAARSFFWTTALGCVWQCWCSCFCSSWGFWAAQSLSWCGVSLPKPSSSRESCRELPSMGLSRASGGPSLAAALPVWCWGAAQSTSHFPGWDRQTLISSSAFSYQNYTPSSDVDGMELNSARNSTPLFLCTQDRCKKPKKTVLDELLLQTLECLIFLTIS